MMIFLLALRIYQMTGSNTAVSLLFLAYGVPSVLVGLIAGVIVDRVDKRSVLIICNASRALLVAWLLFMSGNIWFIYILAFFHAIITQFYVPAEAPLIPKLVKQEDLVSANSLFSFTYYSSMALGFMLAGPLLRLAGPYGAFIVIALLFAIAVINVLAVRVQEHGERILRMVSGNMFMVLSNITSDLSEALRAVAKTKIILEALMLLSATQVVLSLLGSLGPGFADQILHIDVRDASIVVLGPAVAGILGGALWVGSIGFRYKKSSLINAGILGGGIVLLCVALFLGFPWSEWFVSSMGRISVIVVSLVLFFLFGVFASLLDVPANSVLQQYAEGDMRGRIYGILTAAVGGIGMLPVVAGGVLADSFGIGRVLLLVGSIVVLYGVYRLQKAPAW